MKIKKNLKSTLIAFLVAFQLISINIINSYAADMVCFEVETATVSKTTNKAEILISIKENCGYAAADITIVSALKIDSIEDLGINAVSNCENGKVNWSRAKNSYSTGDILKITLIIPSDAKEGDSWDINLLVTEIIDENIEPVSYSVIKGKISIEKTESIYNNYGDKLTINYKQKNCIFKAYNSVSEESVNVKWSSSNEKVAVVDMNGLVTAKGVGNTTITSTIDNGLVATTIVTVKYSFLQWLIRIFLGGWLWY